MVDFEINLNNKLTKEVKQIFLPLNLMQLLVLNPRYYMNNNFVYPNKCLNKFILLTSLGLYFSFTLYRIIDILKVLDAEVLDIGTYLYFASYFNLVFYCLGFIVNFINLFIQSERNVAFVLIFQKIHTCLINNESFKSAVNISRISVTIFFAVYFSITCFVIVIFMKTSWVIIFNTMIMLTLDTNMVYAITLINLLTNEAKVWNNHVSMLAKNGCDEEQRKKLFQSYVQIAKCHRICGTVFQQMVLCQTLETFFNSLVNFQLLIVFSKYYFTLFGTKVMTSSFFVLIYIWMIKAMIIQITLGLSFDVFYQAIGDVQDSCFLIITSGSPTDNQIKLCKNILRFHRACFSKMSVCGMFYMDIGHLLRLVALLTNYIVVLLQIAFL